MLIPVAGSNCEMPLMSSATTIFEASVIMNVSIPERFSNTAPVSALTTQYDDTEVPKTMGKEESVVLRTLVMELERLALQSLELLDP